jgi:4-amino-4-deoxy-L-arabinose transferase-like glycosyltransferase
MRRPRPLGLELAIAAVVAFGVLAPGLSRYSLVDPWETHYAEVARSIRHDHDWVHLDWPGAYLDPNEHEGFRSKPVLSFWLMAASMEVFGIADNGGYSGELVESTLTMIAVRLPFVVMAVLGLTLLWWMLARLVSRRTAWLALLVVGSTPMFCLIARQAIPDMPMVACLIGALAMFTMATEHGERPIEIAFTLRVGRRRVHVDHLHVFIAVIGGFLLVQCLYYVAYFIAAPRLAVRGFPNPVVFFPLLMGLLTAGLSYRPWRVLTRPLARTRVVGRLLAMAPITTMRQVYLLWCYAFLGISVLAKGPPAVAVFGLVAVFHVVLLNRWRDLYHGFFEIKRGLLLMIVVFLPWHIAMYLTEGIRFIRDYVFFNILARGSSGVDDSAGTFAYLSNNHGGYAAVIGHGMMLWAALLPAALAAALLRAQTDTREGRVRFMVTLWAVCGAAFFFVVQTKFNHYILPVIPALGLLVAFFLDDMLAGRDRLHPLYAALGIGIVLLLTRDLMWEPERWIEMFVYRYDRPWPWAEPYAIDLSDGFLALGLIAAGALVVATLPWRRIGVAALGVAGLTICVWSLQVYMPVAGTHWGMRDAMRTYYQQRTIRGERIIYYSARQLWADWQGSGDLRHTFETMIPDTLKLGQRMEIRIQLRRANKPDAAVSDVSLAGTATRIGEHDVEVTIPASEREKLAALLAQGAAEPPRRAPPPVHVVDADRLIGWQLYWRGENFWSTEEICGPFPDMRTQFNKNDNVAFRAYISDRSKAPLGRRYFVVTEAGRANSLRGLLPTARARDSFEVLDTTSNKFTLVSFTL